jgi:hypothetical protein
MGGFVDSALANELVVTWYSMTVTPSRRPRHRPPNFESAALRLCIVGDYVRLKAFGRRKVVNEISAHYRVDRSHVFAAIKSVDPKLLAKLEAHAADDVALHRRFAGRQHALVRHHGIRSLDLTRLFS